MSKIKEIQQAILQLEGGRYQTMMDYYLKRKFGYPNFTSLGSQAGTDKPTKGIPDAYVFTERGKYVFIMYGTVQASPFAKIKQDILDCLDEERTQIMNASIEQIVCCHTSSNISTSQNAELHSLFDNLVLIGISDLSLDLHQKYPDIAKEFLSVSVDTNQIIDLATFIRRSGAAEYATPLDIPLEFRNDDVSSIISLMREAPVVMLSGQTGIGKTRLAIEIAQRFCQDTNYNISFIKSNGAPIYEDLRSYFMDGNSHFIVVDDANQLSDLKYLFSMCIDPDLDNKIKVLMTVRDYAKEDILKQTHDILAPVEYTLKRLKNEEIISILEKYLDINNYLYQQQIIQISKGNIRIAIMAGQRAKEGSFEDIKNIAEVYQWFFKRILDKMDKDELLTAMLVAFCEVVTFDQSDSAFGVADIFSLSREVFVDKCLTLHKREIVNVFRNLAVRFDQQNLRDYFLYYMFVEAKKVKLSAIITHFFPKHVNHIVYALQTILSLFLSDDTIAFFEREILIAWREIQKQPFDNQLKYVRTFTQLLGAEALVFVRSSIPLLSSEQENFYTYEFSDKQPSMNARSELLNILASFKHTELYSDAISLLIQMLNYSSKNPDDYYYQMKHELSPDFESHYYSYKAELTLIDELMSNYTTTHSISVGFYLLYYAKCCLRFKFEGMKYNDRFSMTFVRFGYLKSSESLELRKKCFESFDVLFAESTLKQKVLETLYKFPDICEDENVIPLLEQDCSCFTEFCSKYLSPADINSCILMYKFSKICSRHKIHAQVTLDLYKMNANFVLLKDSLRQINTDRISYKQAIRLQAMQISTKTSKMSLESFEDFFSAISQDFLHKSNNWDVQSGILLILGSLEKVPSKYVDVVKIYLSCRTPFQIHGKSIVLKLIEFLGYSAARKILNQYEYADKGIWLCYCDNEIPLELITKDTCLNFLSENSFKKNTILSLDTIVRVDNKFPGYLVEYTKAIIEKFSAETWVMGSFLDNSHELSPDYCQLILEKFNGEFECLKQAYMLAISGNHFDYDGHLLLTIVHEDPQFLAELFSSMDSSVHDNSHALMHLWEADNYSQVIKCAVEIKNDPYMLSAGRAAVLFKQTNIPDLIHKQDAWLQEYIDQNYNDAEKMHRVFRLLEEISEERRISLVMHLCKLTNSFELFKTVPLFAYSYSWSGSEVPTIEKKILYLKKLRDELSNLPQMFEHIAYLNSMVFSLESRKEEVLYTEFIENNVGV